jgi:hypothetical protein
MATTKTRGCTSETGLYGNHHAGLLFIHSHSPILIDREICGNANSCFISVLQTGVVTKVAKFSEIFGIASSNVSRAKDTYLQGNEKRRGFAMPFPRV